MNKWVKIPLAFILTLLLTVFIVVAALYLSTHPLFVVGIVGILLFGKMILYVFKAIYDSL